MRKECIYTEIKPNNYSIIKVDVFNHTYTLLENKSEKAIDFDLYDFVSQEIFEAIIIGLNTKGYKLI